MEHLIEAIDNLTETISHANGFDLNAWIMVAITFIYVVATIIICIANLRSAKATREQVAEQKRQFDETNRPVVDVTIDTVQGTWLGFVFQNTGHKLAREISVKVNDDFIEKLEDHKERIVNLTDSAFILGIGQMHVVSFCVLGEQSNLDKATIKVTYRDDKNEYFDEFTFELSKNNWRLIDTSDLAQIRKHIKKIAEKK